MSNRPVIPVRPVAGKPSPEALAQLDRHWRPRYLMLAPHRLGFFLAMVLLVTASLWWCLVQVSWVDALPLHPMALSPALVHAAVMVHGFIPLFFSGFLFTAVPKWLGVEPWDTQTLRPALLLQAAGWLVWLAGAHLATTMAWLGAMLAWAGLLWMAVLFWRLLSRSRAEDQMHARAIGVALLVGVLGLCGVWASLAGWGAAHYARAFVLTSLWGFVLVVYVTVAHRMIPFFTSGAMPFIEVWRPFWLLWLMLAAAAFEVIAVWVEFGGFLHGTAASVWTFGRGLVELVIGGVLWWLAGVWGWVQSLKSRLLAMLHIGFLWLGVSFVFAAVSQWLGLLDGAPVLGLGALHALTMGCLGSLMLAMVTRVSCGHSGRALVADRIAWSLFWVLQAATLLRIVASFPSALSPWLLLVAAFLWAGVAAVWGTRLGAWYGRLRVDGRPG